MTKTASTTNLAAAWSSPLPLAKVDFTLKIFHICLQSWTTLFLIYEPFKTCLSLPLFYPSPKQCEPFKNLLSIPFLSMFKSTKLFYINIDLFHLIKQVFLQLIRKKNHFIRIFSKYIYSYYLFNFYTNSHTSSIPQQTLPAKISFYHQPSFGAWGTWWDIQVQLIIIFIINF